jgi:hypothetical protein
LFLLNNVDLFTCDVDIDNLPFDPPEQKLTKKEQKLKRAKMRMARDRFRDLCFTDQLKAAVKFEVDQDLVIMREPYKKVSASFSTEGLTMLFRTFTKHSRRVSRNT